MKNTPFSTYTLSYADWRDYKIHMVNMSYRDLQIIVDVLERLFQAIAGTYGEEPAPEFLGKAQQGGAGENAPCRSATGMADVIGLDKSYPKCKKHLEKQQEAQNDVGGEALTLVTTRGAR